MLPPTDKLEIAELAARYETAFDAGDIDEHMATWAPEMRFESPFGTYDTPAGYREWVTGFYEQTQDEYGGTRHLITNVVIDGENDTATMSCYLTILARDGAGIADAPGRAVIAGTSAFPDDHLRRIDGEWKFVDRTLVFDQVDDGES